MFTTDSWLYSLLQRLDDIQDQFMAVDLLRTEPLKHLTPGYTQLLKCVSPGYTDAAHGGPAGWDLQWLVERRAEDQRHFHQVQQQCSWSKNTFISEHQVQVISHPVLCLSQSLSVFRYHLIEEHIHLWASSPGYFPPCPQSVCLCPSLFSDISGPLLFWLSLVCYFCLFLLLMSVSISTGKTCFDVFLFSYFVCTNFLFCSHWFIQAHLCPIPGWAQLWSECIFLFLVFQILWPAVCASGQEVGRHFPSLLLFIGAWRSWAHDQYQQGMGNGGCCSVQRQEAAQRNAENVCKFTLVFMK